MRKIAVIALFCFTSILAKAQTDYCADINKLGSELTQKVFYSSRGIWFNSNSNVRVEKVVQPGIKALAIRFRNFASVLDIHKQGLFIKFDDGTFYRDENIKSDVEVSSANRWEYDTVLIIPKEIYERFVLHKIVAANFAFSGDVTFTDENSGKLIQYLICCNSLN